MGNYPEWKIPNQGTTSFKYGKLFTLRKITKYYPAIMKRLNEVVVYFEEGIQGVFICFTNSNNITNNVTKGCQIITLTDPPKKSFIWSFSK